jgi:hypothetical protein
MEHFRTWIPVFFLFLSGIYLLMRCFLHPDDLEQFWIWGSVFVLFPAATYFLMRWLHRRDDAEPVPGKNGWVLRYNIRLRLAMLAGACFFNVLFLWCCYQMFKGSAEAEDVHPVVWYLCLTVPVFFFLVSLGAASDTWLRRVVLSEQGLTIETPFRRRVTVAWEEIAEVTYSSGLEVYRVHRKGGGVKWVPGGLNGMGRFHDCLDYYLWVGDPGKEQAYVAGLKHSDWYVRRGAALGLSRIGAAAGRAVPDLAARLRDEEAVVRSWAAAALGAIGPEANAAVSTLRQALNDKDEDVRCAASAALRLILS